MVSGTFFELVAWLYYLGFVLLAALALFIALHGGRVHGGRTRGRRRTRHRAQLRRTFLLLALSLLLWQGTLFWEVRAVLPAAQLWLGRLNFTAIIFTAALALRFVQAVPAQGVRAKGSLAFWWRAETGLLAALTLLTPLVDAAEEVTEGQAITTFGPLFPVYLVHVLGYLGAALGVAFRERRRARNAGNRMVSRQLTLIGLGSLATGGIAVITNAVLPYGYGDFRFCDIGPLSTIFFVLAIAYATFLVRLFALRVVLRETLVYGILLTFVLGSYSSAVFVVSQYLTEGAGKATQFAVLLIAFSCDPLRRFLEEKADRLLFGPRREKEENQEENQGAGKKLRGNRRRRGRHRSLALVFPWRRS